MTYVADGPVKRVLIYRTGSLGDTIVALPALYLIRKSFPGAELWLLSDQPEHDDVVRPQELLRGTGLVDHYINYTLNKAQVFSVFKMLMDIRAIGADILIYLPEWRNRRQLIRDRLFFLLAGLTKTIGWQSNPKFYRSRLLANGMSLHETDRLLQSIACLGTIDPGQARWWDLHLRETDAVTNDRINTWPGKCIVFSYGAKTDVQKWGADKWQRVFEKVSRKLPDTLLCAVGSRLDSNVSQKILRCWHGTSLNLCGQLSVRQSAWLMHKSDLFLGHDSGPAHLAAAVQLPCVCVYSARNPFGKWFPYGQHKVFYKQVDCRECGKSSCSTERKKCIRLIDENKVARAVLACCQGGSGDIDHD